MAKKQAVATQSFNPTHTKDSVQSAMEDRRNIQLYQSAPTSPEGIAMRNETITKYYRYIMAMVNNTEFVPSYNKDDVLHDSVVRMITHILAKYNIEGTASLKTYLIRGVKREIAMSNQRMRAHLSGADNQFSAILTAEKELGKQGNLEPSAEEIAQFLRNNDFKHKMKVKTIKKVLAIRKTASLDADISRSKNNRTLTRHETIAAKANIEVDIDTRIENTKLYRAVSALPERLRTITDMEYFQGATRKEIADQFGISQERVQQLLAKSHEQLRIKYVNQDTYAKQNLID